jgi:hypothetical protein
MPEHRWKGCGWRKIKRLRNVFQIVIRTTFPALRIVGYQEHALRNVQPRQQRAKIDAIGSNSSSLFTQATVPTLIDENDPVWRRMHAKGYQGLNPQSPELMPDVWRENEGYPRRERNLVFIPVDPCLSDSLKHRDRLQIGMRVQRGFISRRRSLNAEPYRCRAFWIANHGLIGRSTSERFNRQIRMADNRHRFPPVLRQAWHRLEQARTGGKST